MSNLINFANLNLCEVSTDRVCSEGREVENLISLTPSERRRGFLADHFVKPPVTIDFTFRCEIDIKRIEINRRVGTQKSAGFDVLTLQSTRNDRMNAGKHIVKRASEDRVEFYIHGRQSSYSESSSFKSSSYLTRVIGLSIKIFKTENSTVPALGGIDVWGLVSKTASKTVAEEVRAAWAKLSCSNEALPVDDGESAPCREDQLTLTPAEDTKPSSSIPEEFIDPISCQIMTIPMTLPSGKIVDASTLEKYTLEQQRLGRAPNDPFTGVLFSDSNKPVVATGLRARLDRYLLAHANHEEVKRLPRALGSKLKASDSEGSHPTASSWTGNKKSNVDDLLEATLQGLPSYLEAKPKRTKHACNSCPNGRDLFVGKCRHLMCRQCLRKVQSGSISTCAACGVSVDYKEFTKFHAASGSSSLTAQH